MTTLEIVLIAIIWIAYGCFSAWKNDVFTDIIPSAPLIAFIIVAPIILSIRAFVGIFYLKD